MGRGVYESLGLLLGVKSSLIAMWIFWLIFRPDMIYSPSDCP